MDFFSSYVGYVEAHGIREESASDLALNVDKEAIPPSSEDRLTRKPIEAQISLALNSNRDMLFIGAFPFPLQFTATLF